MGASRIPPPGAASQGVDAIVSGFERLGYVADRSLATALYLVTKLRKPILVEGHAGLGKTEIAKVLASFLGTRLIRLQCYEGLDVSSAVYEWNYQKQLLAIKIEEGSNKSVEEKEKHIFSREFLLERPLLQSILVEDAAPCLLYTSPRNTRRGLSRNWRNELSPAPPKELASSFHVVWVSNEELAMAKKQLVTLKMCIRDRPYTMRTVLRDQTWNRFWNRLSPKARQAQLGSNKGHITRNLPCPCMPVSCHLRR